MRVRSARAAPSRCWRESPLPAPHTSPPLGWPHPAASTISATSTRARFSLFKAGGACPTAIRLCSANLRGFLRCLAQTDGRTDNPSAERLNLVDEYLLSIYPLILGPGRRLFPEGVSVALRLVEWPLPSMQGRRWSTRRASSTHSVTGPISPSQLPCGRADIGGLLVPRRTKTRGPHGGEASLRCTRSAVPRSKHAPFVLGLGSVRYGFRGLLCCRSSGEGAQNEA